MDKPTVKLIGEDGNVFNIMGIVTRELKRNGLIEEAKEYTEKVFNCDSYKEALRITMAYVDVE
jgi:hypothetical protein